jgi:hypothetical protein
LEDTVSRRINVSISVSDAEQPGPYSYDNVAAAERNYSATISENSEGKALVRAESFLRAVLAQAENR